MRQPWRVLAVSVVMAVSVMTAPSLNSTPSSVILTMPFDTNWSLTKNDSKIVIFQKLRISCAIPRKVCIFRRFWGFEIHQKFRKIILRALFFVIVLRTHDLRIPPRQEIEKIPRKYQKNSPKIRFSYCWGILWGYLKGYSGNLTFGMLGGIFDFHSLSYSVAGPGVLRNSVLKVSWQCPSSALRASWQCLNRALRAVFHKFCVTQS